MSLFKLYLLPFASAVMLGLTRTALPLDLLVIVAFIPLLFFFEITKQNVEILFSKPYFILLGGTIFSVTFLCISIHWITLVTTGGFIGMLFIFTLVFCLMFYLVIVINRIKPIFFYICFPTLWLLNEHLWNFSEISFPWFNIAYGLKNCIHLLQLLEFGGTLLIGILILTMNYLLYLGLTKSRLFVGSGIVIFCVWLALGFYRKEYIEKHTQKANFTVALIQGNIMQDIKWEEDMRDETFEIYEKLSLEAKLLYNPNLMVFPEAALPVHLYKDPLYLKKLHRLVDYVNTPIFTGFPHFERESRYKGQDSAYLSFNSADLFVPNRRNQQDPYHKNILVPFGERIPLLHIFPFLWKLQMGQANFESGKETNIFKVDNHTFAPLICFEIAFPYFLKKIKEEYNPDFFVNITNDAWFYTSLGTYQHAKMATFRSIETRKPIFRAANTGYSFYTTPTGRIHNMTKLFERTEVIGELYLFTP